MRLVPPFREITNIALLCKKILSVFFESSSKQVLDLGEKKNIKMLWKIFLLQGIISVLYFASLLAQEGKY